MWNVRNLARVEGAPDELVRGRRDPGREPPAREVARAPDPAALPRDDRQPVIEVRVAEIDEAPPFLGDRGRGHDRIEAARAELVDETRPASAPVTVGEPEPRRDGLHQVDLETLEAGLSGVRVQGAGRRRVHADGQRARDDQRQIFGHVGAGLLAPGSFLATPPGPGREREYPSGRMRG